MYALDLIFLSLVILLMISPFVLLVLPFEKFSLANVFYAISAISVIILSWERIGSIRQDRLRRLFQYRLSIEEQKRVSDAFTSLVNSVSKNKLIEPPAIESVGRLMHILKTYGTFMKIDQLVPCQIIIEVQKLSTKISEYNQKRKEFDTVLENKVFCLFDPYFSKRYPKMEQSFRSLTDEYPKYVEIKERLKRLITEEAGILGFEPATQPPISFKEWDITPDDVDRLSAQLKNTEFIKLMGNGYWIEEIVQRTDKLENILKEFELSQKPFID